MSTSRGLTIRRIVRIAGGVLLLAGVVGLLTAPHARAQTADTGSYEMTARADVISIASSQPSLAGSSIVYLTPATAQATVNDLPVSQGLASAPYAGDFVVNLPGTVNGLESGKFPPLPPYPFEVSSDVDTHPDSEQRQGPYVISSHSSQLESTAEARLGLLTSDPTLGAFVATADAKRNQKDSGALADAHSQITGFGFGQLLRIGDVSSHATVTVGADGTVHKASALQLGTMTVAGIPFGLTDKGLVVGGTTPSGVDLTFITNLLSQNGLKLSYIPGTQTDKGITSAAVQVTYTTNIPSQGHAVMNMVLGQVTASARSSAGGSGSGEPAVAGETSPAGAVGIGALPSASAVPTLAGVPSSSAPALATAPSMRRRSIGVPRSIGAAVRLPSTRSIYLVLVLAGVAAVVGSQLIANLAVRLRFASR